MCRKPRTVSLALEEAKGSSLRSDSEADSDSDFGDPGDYEPPEVDEAEAAALEAFMASEPAVRRTLADAIAEKLAEKEAAAAAELGSGGPASDIPPPVLAMYQGVRDVLKTYKSGRLPKAFKVKFSPPLSAHGDEDDGDVADDPDAAELGGGAADNGARGLELGRHVPGHPRLRLQPLRQALPEVRLCPACILCLLNGTTLAGFSTSFFFPASGMTLASSGSSTSTCTRPSRSPSSNRPPSSRHTLPFSLSILGSRIGAVKALLFIFFSFSGSRIGAVEGMLIPLCEEGTCTLREATIIGSVMSKCSIPVLHAAAGTTDLLLLLSHDASPCAAMLLIAEMDYAGANSLFLRILIDKAYTLPYRVLDALAAHFVRYLRLTPRLVRVWR